MCVNTWGGAERENRKVEKLLGEIKMQCLDVLLHSSKPLLCLLCINVDALDSCENQTNSWHRWHCWDNNQSCCLCHFPFAAKSDSEWDQRELAVTHSLLFEIYFSVCVCQALGTILISNRKVEQTKRAFPQINRDQSLHFDRMTKQKQQLSIFDADS